MGSRENSPGFSEAKRPGFLESAAAGAGRKKTSEMRWGIGEGRRRVVEERLGRVGGLVDLAGRLRVCEGEGLGAGPVGSRAGWVRSSGHVGLG